MALTLGAGAGGLVLGAVAWLLGAALMPVPEARLGVALALVLAAIVGATNRRLFHTAFPTRFRQLEERLVLAKPRVVVGFRWGFDLGLGLRTLAVTPFLFALVGILVGVAPGKAALIGGITYGLVRGALIAARAARRSECLPHDVTRRALDWMCAGFSVCMVIVLVSEELLHA